MFEPPLRLIFNDNGTGHADVVLHFAGQQWICDSYYFAIDDGIATECDDGEAKIRAVLRNLLHQWQKALRTLKIAEIAFLPYDFSDQSTSWLRCTRVENGFVIQHGWSRLEGWSFSPSSIGELLHGLEDFRADGPSLEVSALELAQAIDDSLSSAA